MTNQRDDGFKDSNNQDDIFASDDDPMNETFDAHRLTSVVDINTDDDSGDISDYDDNDDGIFAPPPQKKKTSSSALLGTVALVALLGAGGFALYKNPGIYSSLVGADSNEVTIAPQVQQETPVVTATTPEPVAPAPTGEATPSSSEIAPLAQADADLAAIPQPQPIINVASATPVSTAPVIAAVDTSVPAPAPTPVPAVAAASATSETPVSGNATVATEAMPAPPSPTETQAVAEVPVIETPVAKDVSKEPEAPVKVVTSAPVKVNVTTTKVAPVDLTGEPDVPLVAPPAVESLKPVPDVVMEDPVITAQVKPLPKPKVDTVYFDAPKGKAMAGIPAPSMDPKRGKNESVIVVDQAITSTSQEPGVAAAGRALRLGRYDAAISMFDDLYRANPRDPRILMGRAVTLQKLGRTGEAIEAYEEVLTIDQDNPEAIVNLMGLIRKQYPARALEKLLELRASHPDNAGIMAQLGVAYADSGNFEDALKYLGMATKAEPNNPQHYFNLGVISERMKNRQRAIAYYEKALETDAVYGTGRGIDRDMIYDRLTRLRS